VKARKKARGAEKPAAAPPTNRAISAAAAAV